MRLNDPCVISADTDIIEMRNISDAIVQFVLMDSAMRMIDTVYATETDGLLPLISE